MLIVIVIIGILAAALVPRLQDIQWRARDTKRKTDISQIHNALLIYQADNGNYPQPANASWTCAFNDNCYRFSYENASRISGIVNIMTSIPADPLNNWVNPWATDTIYSYAYGNIWFDKQTFALHAKLENKNDSDRCAVQSYKFYTTAWAPFSCTNSSGWCPYCPLLYTRADAEP